MQSPHRGQHQAAGLFTYMMDWFAPHLDQKIDSMVNEVGHAVLRIGGHLIGPVQVEDTHAHAPMTKL